MDAVKRTQVASLLRHGFSAHDQPTRVEACPRTNRRPGASKAAAREYGQGLGRRRRHTARTASHGVVA
jgi:hypothetical protein